MTRGSYLHNVMYLNNTQDLLNILNASHSGLELEVRNVGLQVGIL